MLPAPLLALTLAALAAAPAQEAGPEPVRRGDIPVALVLSGGVSLGSYEAGLSWAVVEFSRRAGSRPLAAGAGAPRLVAVTGASAGSINALLSALLWCSSPAGGEGSVERNLLRDVWAPVGLDGLLPEDPGGYAPGDALLSTRPLLAAIDRFQRRVAEGGFRPGCRLPVGLTVTRERAAEHEVGALTVRTQRFALPWRLEVGGDGVPRVVSQRLGATARPDVLEVAGREQGRDDAIVPWPQAMQGILASAAFPVAFRARELCDCAPRCPLSNQVTSGTCEGPAGPITALSCPARSPEGEPLTLCSHRYVDGGIFDNTPVGLNVDLAESVSTAQPLQPVTYVYIDPGVRRLRPASSETPSSIPARTPESGGNLADAARLAAELVATARTEDVGRTLKAGGWNLTTRNLLYETAASLRSFAEVQRHSAVQLGRPATGPEPTGGELAPGAAARGAIAHVLLRCFPQDEPDPERVRACVRELSDAAAGRAPSRDAREPTDEEVVRVAEAMRDAAARALRGSRGRSAPDADRFALEMRVAAAGMTFLAEEMTRVARTSSEPAQRRFRAALLGTVQLGRALGVEVAHLANAAVLEQLEALASDGVAGAAARRASATLRAAPDVLFVPDDLDPVLEAPGSASAPPLRSLRALAGVAPALQAEIVRVNRLARAADALQQTRAERALVVSSRFAPITGSQLANFGAFLDRPFRDYDYFAGVYDASHAIAVSLCEAEAVTGAPRPVRDARSPTALDHRARETQRCVGIALDAVLRELEVDRSPTADHVVRRLAAAELEASLGAAAAGQLRDDPSWAWLARPPRAPPEARVATIADALLSPRVECAPGDAGACLRELSFDELVAALRARGYAPHDPATRALFDDADAWTRRTVRRLLDRSYDRERASPGAYELAPAVLLAHRVGELWLRSPHGGGPFPRLVLDPSTIPARPEAVAPGAKRLAAHLVPYRLELDVARGGVSASWLDPALWLGPRASVVAELTAVSYEASGGRLSSSAALLPTGHFAGLSIGAGPRLAFGWRHGSVSAGAIGRVSAFQQRFSVSLGTDSLRGSGGDLFVTIGVTDLNGALFWLLGR